MRLLSIGNCTIDSVVLPGGEPLHRLFGGDSVYAAVGAALWGVDVGLVSAVGDDYPREWFVLLEEHGISTGAVTRVGVPHALVAPMTYDEEGERHDGGAELTTAERLAMWRQFSPVPDQLSDESSSVDAVHLASMPIDRQDGFLELFAGRGPLISIDLPWWPDMYAPGELPRIELASVVLLSVAEAHGHFPGRSMDWVGRELLSRGAKIVAVKIGARGSLVFLPDRAGGRPMPAMTVPLVDPTGAGDAYCGGFLTGLAETGDADVAAMYGTVSASFIIGGFTAAHALGCTSEQARERLRELRTATASAAS